ncbi:phage late control D family protein [Klebsiella pneumoniae]
MADQAVFEISVAGQPVTERFNAILEQLSVTDKAGTTSDNASITLDDSDGQIAMPSIGDPMQISLGWQSTGASLVFDGVVETIRSTGSRGGGRQMTITAKGFDTKGKAKEPLEFHKDDASLQDFMGEAARRAGLTMQVQGALASIRRPYWAAATESFIHLGHRIAREVGGQFKIRGTMGIIYARNAGLSVSGGDLGVVVAELGVNLIDWDISPAFARPRYQTVRARYYDAEKAKWLEKTVQVGTQGPASDATHTHRQTRADEDEAEGSATDNQRSSERERGGGTVTIIGNPAAQPEGGCQVVGARPGVDGTYRIDSVQHDLSRGSGYTTKLELKHPEGEAGTDSRE